MSDFEQAVEVVLKHEGGLADDPADPGGITNFGISLRFAKAELDPAADPAWVRGLTKEAAKEIYRSRWWDKYGYGLILDQTCAAKLFDASVNVGPHQAHLLAQRVCLQLNKIVALDGVMGPKTIAAVNGCFSVDWVREMCVRQAQFYLELIDAKPKLGVFKSNWLKRAAWPNQK